MVIKETGLCPCGNHTLEGYAGNTSKRRWNLIVRQSWRERAGQRSWRRMEMNFFKRWLHENACVLVCVIQRGLKWELGEGGGKHELQPCASSSVSFCLIPLQPGLLFGTRGRDCFTFSEPCKMRTSDSWAKLNWPCWAGENISWRSSSIFSVSVSKNNSSGVFVATSANMKTTLWDCAPFQVLSQENTLLFF